VIVAWKFLQYIQWKSGLDNVVIQMPKRKYIFAADETGRHLTFLALDFLKDYIVTIDYPNKVFSLFRKLNCLLVVYTLNVCLLRP